MLTTLNGMFLPPKPHKTDFIKENKKKLKEISSMVYQNKSKLDIQKKRNSQMDINRSTSGSSTTLKENKMSNSSCKLGGNKSMAVFFSEKKDKRNSSSVSILAKQKPSQKFNILKNQSCQTIDPRRCDQLFHEGVIKYPSSKVLQELEEVEKQKANRLDAHVKKEFFKRYKIKHKNQRGHDISKFSLKGLKKEEDGDELKTDESSEEEIKDKQEENQQGDQANTEPEPEPQLQQPQMQPQPEPVVQSTVKPFPQPVMRAAEIIRKTTEDINYSTRRSTIAEHTPNSKGDSLQSKKLPKKLTREEEILKTVLDPQCPPGHIPLPDSERKKTLHMLRVSHAELVREMNLLPVRTDTLRIRQRKIQLENQLNKIEEGIKVFNKSKVYVKIEE